MSPARRFLGLFVLLGCPALAQAGGMTCQAEAVSSSPVRTAVLAPVAIELAPLLSPLGAARGVLAQSFDEALAADVVLARIRLDGCLAMLRKASQVAPAALDAAAYTPKTQYDNTPWRFNMTQNGKRMTADEFDAWMKARGVRVVGRKDADAATTPAATGQP